MILTDQDALRARGDGPRENTGLGRIVEEARVRRPVRPRSASAGVFEHGVDLAGRWRAGQLSARRRCLGEIRHRFEGVRLDRAVNNVRSKFTGPRYWMPRFPRTAMNGRNRDLVDVLVAKGVEQTLAEDSLVALPSSRSIAKPTKRASQEALSDARGIVLQYSVSMFQRLLFQSPGRGSCSACPRRNWHEHGHQGRRGPSLCRAVLLRDRLRFMARPSHKARPHSMLEGIPEERASLSTSRATTFVSKTYFTADRARDGYPAAA